MRLEQLRDNLERVRERIATAALRSGRAGSDVQVLAVTKTHPVEVVDLAYQAGIRLLGENRVQEAVAKYGRAPGAAGQGSGSGAAPGAAGQGGGLEATAAEGRWPGIDLHLIGHLQRNKARLAAGLFHCVQSIDKLETAQALSRVCQEAGRSVDVLLELNTSGEASKSGFEEESALLETAAAIRGLPRLRLRGLMTVGPLTDDAGRVAAAFAGLRRLYERLRGEHPGIDVLSMGMSGDFEIAVREGATMVRLGTVLFGPRRQPA